MTLTESQKKFLRGLGHNLKPVITVGDAGLSESLLKEFESTIAHHELIKVRIRAPGREQRDATIAELCERGSADLVTRIGNVALLFRPNAQKPRIVIPSA
jgi:RNA-binding protein